MKIIIVSFLCLFCTLPGVSQTEDITRQAYDTYEDYRESSITDRRFKHADIMRYIDGLKGDDRFEVSFEGSSVEGREIYLVKFGSGDISVLLWSQMHGNEPTGTMALLDIFNFFRADDGFNQYREELFEKITVYAIPLLNPDGAEKFQRRNAFGIDVNRDALRLQSPEARILKDVRDRIDADFGFNLHDQNPRYTAGNNPESAAISFLAPTYDYEKSTNEVRSRAMKLIAQLTESLNAYIPGHIAKYNDDFEPRAFGDNIQKWGTSTILVESGGYKGDPEKQYLRKLNYVLYQTAFQSIAGGGYNDYSTGQYEEIPFNATRLFDVLLREVVVTHSGQSFKVDIGINHSEVEDEEAGFYKRGSIRDVGDLSIHYGYEEYNAGGLKLDEGSVYPEVFNSMEDLKARDPRDLLSRGYTAVQLAGEHEAGFTGFPLNILLNDSSQQTGYEVGSAANFVLKDGQEVRFAVVNGFVYDLQKDSIKPENSLIIN